MATASGTLYRSDSKERITGATIKASKGSQVSFTTTDDDGDFSLDCPEPGTWEFVALDEQSFPNKPLSVDMSVDQSDIKIYLSRIAGEVDEAAGKKTFWVILGILVALIILYLVLHLAFFKDPMTGFSFWTSDPLRLLEILFWGLAGILINKIMMIGWYLRSQRFYKQGIIMHIAHIAATPLLVLVTVFVLSLVTLNITLAGDNEITIDLSEPNLMVAFAFIIGANPWPLWRFIENAGKRFTSQFD